MTINEFTVNTTDLFTPQLKLIANTHNLNLNDVIHFNICVAILFSGVINN